VDVSLDDRRRTQIDATRSHDVSGEMAEDDDIANTEIGFYACVGTDRETALREGDGSFNVSIDEKVFIARELSPDDDRLTDDGGTFCWLHKFFCSPLGTVKMLMRLARTIPKLMP
jgi:hypothetical protein